MTEPREHPPKAADGQGDRRPIWLLLIGVVGMLAFQTVLLPRLTNVHFGDIEFTGWSGPVGSRLLRGDRPYVDFVLPIPPGSFVLLAIFEKLQGRLLLLHELGMNLAIHLLMGLIAYGLAAELTSRRNAVLVALATLVTVVQLNKECAYDHTAQIVAWLSIWAGARALLRGEAGRSRRLWVAAGALAGFTLLFKQSTGVGIVLGWGVCFAYLSLITRWSGGRPSSWLGAILPWAQGTGLGLASVWLVLVLAGSTARAFLQATFLDASTLKGGPRLLAKNLFVYLFDYPAYPASLAMIAVAVIVGLRVIRRNGSLHIGDEPERRARLPLSRWEFGAVLAIAVCFPAVGIGFLLKGPAGYPLNWVLVIDRLKQVPMLGLVTVAIVFVAHVVRAPEVGSSSEMRSNPLSAGHAQNAIFLAALSCSLLHNTSAPEFRPFYDNNPIIPLTFTSLFVVLDRADLRPVSVLLLALMYGSVAGNKYYRAMTATIPFGPEGYWAFMKTTDRGQEIARAAARVRKLTAPHETVLVLPEDVQIETLIGRPRPSLVGAIVFVDQYPPRLAADDIDRIDEHPPTVVVVHPREPRAWQRFFRIWSGTSGAERVLDHVLNDMLPDDYELDSTYPTTFLWEPGGLEIYVRKEGKGREPPPETADTEEPAEPPREPSQ